MKKRYHKRKAKATWKSTTRSRTSSVSLSLPGLWYSGGIDGLRRILPIHFCLMIARWGIAGAVAIFCYGRVREVGQSAMRVIEWVFN